MRVIRRTIAGLTVVMEPTEHPSAICAGAATFVVTVDAATVAYLTYSDHEGHKHWYCDCCKERSSQKDPILSHVVLGHATLPPLLTADRGRTFEAMNTYLRLAGKHADPTYIAAMRNIYGSSW